ncbi:MAG: hypothetical protein K8U03_04110 [Planctomycetia bacterium]|nr:hypothetical protein [Planctomycetia bacterium]
MRSATLAALLSILACWQGISCRSASAQTLLTRADQKKLMPGLVVVVYPRHATQSGREGAFVEQKDLGAPVQAPGNPYVINTLYDWKFPADFNAIATGLLKIDVAGDYLFSTNSTWDRNSLSVNGQMICPYRDGEQTVAKIRLEKGYVPIVCGGYFASRGTTQVTWQPPGAQALMPIPSELFFFLPEKKKR